MPRRDYDEYDDDRPRRSYRRDPDDDRPRPSSRRYDEADDYDDRPPHRRGKSSSPAPVILAVVGIAFLFLIGAAVVGFLVFRSAAKPNPAPAPAWAGGPPPPQMPMGPQFGPPPGMGGPAMPPGMPVPAPPPTPAPQGNEVTISNLKLQRGFAGRNELVFDYKFHRGRPIGLSYVAVVTQPDGQQATADLHVFDQEGTLSLREFGPFGGNFPSRTTVYIGKRQFGPRLGVPAPPPISNTLTLP